MSRPSAAPRTDPLAALLALLDEAFDRRSWHGTNLAGSLRGMKVDAATWRTASGAHSIADIVVHCAYWKYTVRRRLRGEKRGTFPLKGSDWFDVPPTLAASAWRGYVGLLKDEHAQLRAAIADLAPRQLAERPGRGDLTIAALVRGVTLHDVYHAGQIQTIKRGNARA